MKKHRSKSAKIEFQILAMLAFFSLSVGLWENFRQLWLQDNGFSASDVSMITSAGILISVVGIVIVGQHLKPRHLKNFMLTVLFLKTLDLLLLFSLNGDSAKLIIDACIAIDVLTSCLIVTSVYPLITTVIKSNRVYSKRKLVEYLFRDLGILVGGVLIGWQLLPIPAD